MCSSDLSSSRVERCRVQRRLSGKNGRMRRLATVLTAGLLALTACSGSGDSASTTAPTMTAAPTSAGGATSTPSPDAGEPEGTKTFTGLEQTHVDTPVNYPQTPPVGGPHNPQWQTCAFYDKPIMVERGVHSMEHGAVWITYSEIGRAHV